MRPMNRSNRIWNSEIILSECGHIFNQSHIGDVQGHPLTKGARMKD